MTNTLTFVTETDHEGNPQSYALTGQITDWDGKPVYVGEFTFNFNRAWETLMYYTREFKSVEIHFETKEQTV